MSSCVRSKEDLLLFTDLIRHYSIVKGCMQPETGFLFIEDFINGKNPFENRTLLKRFVNELQESSTAKYYLGNPYIKPLSNPMYEELWVEVAIERKGLKKND